MLVTWAVIPQGGQGKTKEPLHPVVEEGSALSGERGGSEWFLPGPHRQPGTSHFTYFSPESPLIIFCDLLSRNLS